MARYTVVVEQGDGEFFAYVPALPGCTSVGQTRGQALDNVVDAMHLTPGPSRRTGHSRALLPGNDCTSRGRLMPPLPRLIARTVAKTTSAGIH